MQQSPSFRATSTSASADIHRIWCLSNPKVHYHAHKSPPLAPVLSQMNPSSSLPTCLVTHHVPHVNASRVHVYCSCHVFRSTSGHREGDRRLQSYHIVRCAQNMPLCRSRHGGAYCTSHSGSLTVWDCTWLTECLSMVTRWLRRVGVVINSRCCCALMVIVWVWETSV